MSAARKQGALGVAAFAFALVSSSSAMADPGAANTLALEALHNYAACAVGRTPEGAAQLLALDPASQDYRDALKRFAKGHAMCTRTGTQLSFAGLPFAGDLAEALIATRYDATALRSAASDFDAKRQAAKVSVSKSDGSTDQVTPDVRTFAASETKTMPEGIGMCVVTQKPDAVLALFQTSPNSKEELAALQPTGQTLAGCVPAGQTLKLNRPAVRAMYALGAYRLLAGSKVHPEG